MIQSFVNLRLMIKDSVSIFVTSIYIFLTIFIYIYVYVCFTGVLRLVIQSVRLFRRDQLNHRGRPHSHRDHAASGSVCHKMCQTA